MITRPFGLESKLSAPPRDFDVLFWVNAGVIALFFTLLGSRFVLAEGIVVQPGAAMVLPTSSATGQAATSVVVSYRRDNMVLFEGGIYELRDLRSRMEDYVKAHPGAVLLVRYDRAVSVQGIVDLSDMAHAVGFARFVIAAEKPAEQEAAGLTPLR
jgi:biopolymer transport protein ExbD